MALGGHPWKVYLIQGSEAYTRLSHSLALSFLVGQFELTWNPWVLCFMVWFFIAGLVTKQLSHQVPKKKTQRNNFSRAAMWLKTLAAWNCPSFCGIGRLFSAKVSMKAMPQSSAQSFHGRHIAKAPRKHHILLMPWYNFFNTSTNSPKISCPHVWPKFKCKRRWSRSSGSQLVATSSSFSSFFGWGSATASSHFTESSLASFFLRAVRPDPEWLPVTRQWI